MPVCSECGYARPIVLKAIKRVVASPDGTDEEEVLICVECLMKAI